jgi:hypothetical protein
MERFKVWTLSSNSSPEKEMKMKTGLCSSGMILSVVCSAKIKLEASGHF